MEIYIIRHGTTEWNKAHRIQGRTDIELDSLGREMARLTGEYFAANGIFFDKVFSSPLKRAYETAKLVAAGSLKDGHDTILVTDPRLAELSFGKQEGCIVEEMVADGAAFRYFKSAPDRYNELIKADETAETLEELYKRAGDFLRDKIGIDENNTGGQVTDATICQSRILISGHGAINKAVMMHILGVTDLKRFWGNGLQPNCGINIINAVPDEAGRINCSVVRENVTFFPEELSKKITQLL